MDRYPKTGEKKPIITNRVKMIGAQVQSILVTRTPNPITKNGNEIGNRNRNRLNNNNNMVMIVFSQKAVKRDILISLL